MQTAQHSGRLLPAMQEHTLRIQKTNQQSAAHNSEHASDSPLIAHPEDRKRLMHTAPSKSALTHAKLGWC
jgi:hypothetical protein